VRAIVLTLILAVACAALPLRAPAMAQETPDVVDIIFTEIEKRIIRSYYERAYRDWAEGGHGKGKHGKDLPPGLARKGDLPPGLAKQLARNGTLPPGLAKRGLPSDLVPLLPLRPDWQEVVIVDDKVLLIRRATNLILDVIEVMAAEAAG
jgi:hypothetical protein